MSTLHDWSTDAELLTFMKRVEDYKTKLYFDIMGNPTIGIGRNLNAGLTDKEILYLYMNSINDSVILLDRNCFWWRDLPDTCQQALVSLAFNLGNKILEFVHFLTAMKAHDWPTAIAELKNSEWWEQVGQRGPMTASLIHD